MTEYSMHSSKEGDGRYTCFYGHRHLTQDDMEDCNELFEHIDSVDKIMWDHLNEPSD